MTSKARAIYTGHHPPELGGRPSPITACIALAQARSFASAAQNGSVHVWKVETSTSSLPRYARAPRLVSNFQFSRPSEHALSLLESTYDGAASLILGTSQGRLVMLDIRTMQVLQTLDHPVHYGAITTVCESFSRDWLATGTAHGHVCLWDLRFGLLLQSWNAAPEGQRGGCEISAIINHPDSNRPNSVLIAMRDTSRSGDGVIIKDFDIHAGRVVATLATGPRAIKQVPTLPAAAPFHQALRSMPHPPSRASSLSKTCPRIITALTHCRRGRRDHRWIV